MTHTDKLEHLLLQFLYGDMSAAERDQFEQQLATDSELQALLEEERRFNTMLPIGSQPRIHSDRLQGNRWLLQQKLQRERRAGYSFRQFLQGLAQKPLTVAFQGVAMAATFVLGIIIASPTGFEGNNGSAFISAQVSTQPSPLALIDPDDFEIYQLKVNSYDAATGAIDLTYSLASETRVTGNVSDQGIHRLMAAALQDDIDSTARMDTISALQTVRSGSDVYEALIYVLKNDQNPGVRYQAVQSLVTLAANEQVRDALRYALSEDVNSGIRLEAFQALSNYPERETLAVFRRQMEVDSNEYIRARARSIVEGSSNAVIDL